MILAAGSCPMTQYSSPTRLPARGCDDVLVSGDLERTGKGDPLVGDGCAPSVRLACRQVGERGTRELETHDLRDGQWTVVQVECAVVRLEEVLAAQRGA